MKNEVPIAAFAQFVSESHRLRKAFGRLVEKTDTSGVQRYKRQIEWYDKKAKEITESAGLEVVDLEGQEFDEGMALTPLNLDDFDKDEALYIEHMIEPTIVFNEKIIKTGTAMLGRSKKQCT